VGAAPWLLLASLLLLVGGLLLMSRSRLRARSEVVARRFHDSRAAPPAVVPVTGLRRQLQQMGVQVSPAVAVAVLVGGALVLGLIYLLWGGVVVLGVAAALGGVLYGLSRWRYQRRLEQMIHQTPAMLDHMVRSLKSGRTLADAMLIAMDKCQQPLRDGLAATRKSIQLGISLGEALDEFANLHSRDEFRILALGVRVNQRYGGNASEVLQNLITMIRDRERAARQLRALTGETRISALVLGLMPVALAGYIMLSNPTFILGLWESAGGQILLLVALGLQLFGSFLLWRMLRSV
jgi:tight adherence protein B